MRRASAPRVGVRAYSFSSKARNGGLRRASKFSGARACPSAAQVAAARIANGSELKFHDIAADQAAADLSAGVILNTSSINLIAQGVTEKTRVGRKCVIKSVNWRGQLSLSAGSTVGSSQTVRMMVVLDKQANGAAPTVTGVLETANYQSFNNLANKGRFRTLSDATYAMNVQAAAGDGTSNDSANVLQNFAFFKPCDISLEFTGAAGTIDELTSNNLFILMITGTAGSLIALDSQIRLRFTDG